MRELLRRVRNRGLYVKPGHYYSPIPNADDIRRALQASEATGVALHGSHQLELVDRLAPLMGELPISDAPGWRWHGGPTNRMFNRADAALYYAMVADRKPSQIIEVGCGFSSAIALDAAERHSPDTRFTFVEPYPQQQLLRVLRHTDICGLYSQPVQDVPLKAFIDLAPGDFLFIDSTHVAKAGSDVLHLYFEIIPRLQPGVLVHVHDIFWPFTYPKRWLEQGRGWTEAYLLRAMLTEPSSLRIVAWGSWLAQMRPQFNGAGSIWLERT